MVYHIWYAAGLTYCARSAQAHNSAGGLVVYCGSARVVGTTKSRDARYVEVVDGSGPDYMKTRSRKVAALGQRTASENVVALFDAMAAGYSDELAIVAGGGSISYGALRERSIQIAGALIAGGVRPGSVVALTATRSPSAVAGMLGVLRAGAAYVPVDLAFPEHRVRLMLDDSGAELLLLSSAEIGRAPTGTLTMSLDAVPRVEPGALVATAAGTASLSRDSLAYVMYTSGSTGTPKGVEVMHQSIIRLVCDATYMNLGPGVSVLQAAPLGFDASTLEIWGPLLNGGVCVIHPEPVPTAAGLRSTIAAHHVDAAWLTSALFNSIVDVDPTCLAGLKELLVGGEALSVPHVRRFMEAVPGTSLINGYGPTECTTFATTHRIRPEDLVSGGSIPIGRPITATELYVLDPDGRPVARGERGNSTSAVWVWPVATATAPN